MILATPSGKKSRRRIGAPVAALVLGWSGFVLTGAAAEAPPEPEEHAGGYWAELRVVEQDPSAADGEDSALQALHLKTMIERVHALKAARAVFHKQKAQTEFAEAHPTADVDEDRKVSSLERRAFLTAAAMLNPMAVLEQFPKADRNEDGELDENEAARLVTHTKRRIVRPRAQYKEALATTSVDGATGEATYQVKVAPVDQIEGEYHATLETVHEAYATDGQVVYGVLAPSANADVIEPGVAEFVISTIRRRARFPGAWLLENLVEEPSYDDVAYHLETVELARDALILERNPDADVDGDGHLSQDERTTLHQLFLQEKHEIAARQKAFHEGHFEAAEPDTNGMLKLNRTLKELHEQHKQEQEDDR